MIILYFIFLSFLFPINFELQNFSAIINVESGELEQPFTGGMNYAKIAWRDWDQDGDLDLFTLDEDRHFRYYNNKGDPFEHEFHLDEHPIDELNGMNWFHLDDFDNDGTLELVTQSIENPDHAMYYEFDGNDFLFISLLYQNTEQEVISSSVMTPTFVDIDNDGDLDFFTGNIIGTINFYMNIGLNNNVPSFEFISSSWEDIFISGPSLNRHGASAISFIDLDGDLDYDLAWGDYFQRSLYVLWNEGDLENPSMDSNNFLYQFPTSNPVYTSGQNLPSFADIDGDNDMDLFITVLGGDGPVQLNNNFYMYENIGSSSNPYYEYRTDNFLGSLDLLSNVSPKLVDIDNDSDLDMFVGQDFTNITNPTMGRIYQFNNEGFDHPTWTLLDSALLGTNIGLSLYPEFIDINADGELDLFIGDYNGRISYFENIGNPENFEFSNQEYLSDIDLSFFSTPEFCDIDYDGDLDLFIGSYSGGLDYYENLGTPNQFNFFESDFILPNISEYDRTSFEFIDLDNDMDYDLLVGTGSDGLIIYWNIGSKESYDFRQDTCLDLPYFGYNIKITTGAFDDEYNDMIIGISTGGFLHYKLKLISKGDVVLDDIIDILDIVAIVNYILYGDDELNCSMDFNHDSTIDINDIILIVNMVLG